MAAMKFVILLFAIAAVVSAAEVEKKSENLESSETVGLGYYGGYYGANPYFRGYGGYGYAGYPYSAYHHGYGYGGYYPYGHHGYYGYYR
ncbi:transcriptional regulatory protein LGE1-like [Ischnura elegans]|uniref:transcriptional regulatory protein LGE1-like n=1 Tax=Ischnura elegans TaxID=197161 RepID=UPI001ED8A474|nr:transcriptional regulatory protein LGE1-like [Ischnura elegans]